MKIDIKEEKPTFGGLSRRKTSSAKSLLTGRGVTTQMLIEEEILEPGEKCLTINYLVGFYLAICQLNLIFEFLVLSYKSVFFLKFYLKWYCRKKITSK